MLVSSLFPCCVSLFSCVLFEKPTGRCSDLAQTSVAGCLFSCPGLLERAQAAQSLPGETALPASQCRCCNKGLEDSSFTLCSQYGGSWGGGNKAAGPGHSWAACEGMVGAWAGGEFLVKLPMVFPLSTYLLCPSESFQYPIASTSLLDPGRREDVAGSEKVPGEAALLQAECE